MSPWYLGPALLLSIILAGLVLSAGPGRADNRAFFAHSVTGVLHNLAAAYLFMGQPGHPPFLDALQASLGLVWLSSTVAFAWAFPGARPLPWKGLAALVGMTLAGVGARFLAPGPVGMSFYRLTTGIDILLIVAFLVGAQGRAKRGRDQGGIWLVQLVMFSRLALAVWVYAFRGGPSDSSQVRLTTLDLALTPPLTSAVFAYALLRYQLLDIRGFITRSIGLFAVTAVSGTLIVGALEILQRLFRAMHLTPWGEGELLAPGLIILVMLTFNPLKLRLEGLLEGWVNQGLVRARQAVESYHRETAGVLDATRLMTALDRAVAQVLPGAGAAVLIRRPSPVVLTTPGFQAGGIQGDVRQIPCAGGADAARALRQRDARWWTALEGEEIPEVGPLTALGATVILPFQTADDGDGALLIQAPRWEVERLELLHQLALHLGLQLDNALLYQDALDANAALTSANQELADIRLFLEAVVASMPVGLAVLGPGDAPRRWNPAMERITGVSAAAAMACGGLPEVLEGLGPLSALTAAGRGVNRRELRVCAPERPRRLALVNVRLAPLSGEGEAAGDRVLLLTDVTEVVRLEEDLEASRRLAALGQLAAAMAHEIRTPLTSIKLNAQILAGKVNLPPADAEYFDIVLEELDRLNRYVGEILDYARPLKLALSDHDLGELMDEVRRALYFLLAERETELRVVTSGSAAARAEVDAERLKQVLINLVDNASQATEGREDGEVVVTISEQEAPGEAGEPRSGVEIAVADNGAGMDADTLARVFEPFFTTRPTGTGLGLAIAHRIVHSHGGRLSATSEVGAGSVFRVWLPAAGREATFSEA